MSYQEPEVQAMGILKRTLLAALNLIAPVRPAPEPQDLPRPTPIATPLAAADPPTEARQMSPLVAPIASTSQPVALAPTVPRQMPSLIAAQRPSTSATPSPASDGWISTPLGNLPVVNLPSTGNGYFLEVKSDAGYQAVLSEYWVRMRPDRETVVCLTAEPLNPDDPLAVAVQTFAGETVGYLPRDEAARYQQFLVQIEARALVGICLAKIMGGTPRKKLLSLVLDLAAPSAMAAKLGLTYTPIEPTPPRKRPEWVPRRHKDAVLVSSLPISDAAHYDLGAGDGYALGIVGESHRQAALHALDAGRLRNGEQVAFVVSLTREPTNQFDTNAVMVSIKSGAHVGYLQRDDALRYRPVFEALTGRQLIGVARAKLIGGVPGKPSIGVILDVKEPTELLAAIEPQPF